MNRESTRLGQDGGRETRANLILRLEKTKLEMESLRATEREIKKQIQVQDMEEGECSSEEEEMLPEDASEQKYVENTSFQELSTILTEQSKSMAQAMSRQTGLKDLPKFSGDPDEWRIFLAQYQRSTTICGYDSSENVARLEKSLTGEAREAVKALLTSPASADEIIEVLSRRFGNNRQMLLRLIDQAKNIDGPKDDNPLSVVKFATAVHNIAVSLEQLDGGRYLTSVSVVDDLERKLTPIMRMLWSEAVYKRRNYTVKDLSLWLQQRAEAALSIAPINATKSTRSNTIDLKERKKSSVRSVLSVVSQGGENTRRGCANCQEDHYTTVCPKLKELTPEGRFVRVRELKLCLSCLGKNHRIINCFRRRPCGIEGCKRQHHRLLHQKVEKPEEKKTEVISGESSGSVTNDLRHNYFERLYATANRTDRGIVMLRVAPVTLRNNLSGETTSTLALLDSGATVTLIESATAQKLNLEGRETQLNLQWLDSNTRQRSTTKAVTFDIKGWRSKDKWFNIPQCYTIDQLELPQVHVHREELIQRFPYLARVEFKSITGDRPKILIGEDNAGITATKQLIHDSLNNPVASLTNLGWIISGSTGETCNRKRSADVVGHACQELIELIKQHYQFEDMKMKTENSSSVNKDEKKALEILESVTRRIGKRFETGLLWKTPKPEMPDSRAAAWRRLQQVEAKMDKDPKFRDQYSAKIQDYLSKGYLVPLDEHEKGMPKENVWYLPHFGVTNPNKPGKIRVVLDAAAEVNSISLNNSLLSGPNLTVSLTGLLMRFRIGQHGFVGDIKEMFHQVRILPEDQNYQRILWRGNSRDTFPVEYKMTVMIFGATCSPAVASYIKNKNAEEFAEEFPEATREIVENHYVDDYLGSADDETFAIKLIKDVVHVHKMGGFEIRNFVSSSPVIINALPPDLRLPKLSVDLDFDSKFEKVLGVWWEPLTDVFSFRNQESVDTENLPTKRQALKTLMKVYDPVGFVTQFIIRGRIIFQRIWRFGTDWDQQLPAALCQQWKAWVAQLIHLSDVEIPRCYAPLEYRQGRVELHIFTDASEDAYAAVAYFRFVNGMRIHVSLVMAKAKVAPLKSASIPRLELEGAVLGCRLMQVIQGETKIEIDRKVFWTDSVVVLNWIRADSRSYKPFVGNRVGEIQEVTNPDEWKWVPTNLNVADIATRDTGNTDFSPESTWYRGPEFLYKSESEWPQQRESSEFVAATIEHCWEPVIDSKNYMRWSHIHRVMTYVYRFQRACREKWRSNGHSQPGNPVLLSATDWEGGLRYLLIHSQRESFGISTSSESSTDELQLLNVPRGSSLYKFNPAIDSCGVIRASGRLNNMPLVREDFKNPILLHADNRIVQLLLEDFHVRLGHWRADFVLAELRQRYEIIKGRATLKRLQRGCKTCQVAKAKPQIPLMGQLPSERLSMHVVPFTNTGCDMFGPLYVKSGRSEVKRYGMIFTCMTTRAIHLELCCSLSTDSCLLALRRFFGRRGNPAKIISDNGTNFRGAARELKEAAASLDHAKVKAKLAKMNIEWEFNPPYSPHMGGCWERLIGPVKRALKQSVEIAKHPPSEEVLHTLLVEAEHLVNSRPLLELADSGEVLTPNHFLIHRQSGLTPGGIFEDQDLILRKEWRKSQRLADHFWQIWRKHYAPTLTHRPKWRESGQPIIEEDRVVIMEPNTERNQWIFGRVIKAIPAKDGHVRTATIRLEDGSECVRPVTRLAVIRPPPLVMDDDGIGE